MSRRVAFGVRNLGAVALGFALSLCAASQATAQTTVVLDAPDSEVTDTSVRGGGYARTNFDRKALTTRASDNGTYERRALLKFDTHNHIPRGAAIQSAKLVVTVKGGNDESRRISAYRVARSFEEQQATWVVRKNGLNWSSAGGDLGKKYADASVSAAPRSKVTFDVTALVRETVGGAFDSRYTRVALVDAGRASRDSWREYYDSEAADRSVRPVLTVVFRSSPTTVPVVKPVPRAPAPVPRAPAPVPRAPAPVPQPPAPVPPLEPAEPPSSLSTLRVLHWNTHHGGRRTDGRTDRAGLVKWIATLNPHIASLNEVDNESQATEIVSLLKTRTGVKWASRYDGRGNLIVSRLPIVGDSTCLVNGAANRRATHVSIRVNGRPVNIWSAHLAVNSGSTRVSEVKALQACAQSWAEPRIFAGDFNAQASSSEISLMASRYHDNWTRAVAAGSAYDYRGNARFGATRNSRIDYVFTSKGVTWLTLKSAQIFDTRDSNGKMPSDHKPMLVTYTVK